MTSVPAGDSSEPARPTQVPFLICDPNKFVSLTGWRPELGFDRILDDTLGYWRDQLN